MTCEKYHLQESFGPFQDSSLAKPVLSTMKEGGSTPVKASLPSL